MEYSGLRLHDASGFHRFVSDCTVRSTMTAWANVLQSNIREELKACTSVATTVDGWQDGRGRSCQGSTLHYIDPNWHLQSVQASVTAAVYGKTSEGITRLHDLQLCTLLTREHLIVATVSDNASAAVKAGRLLVGEAGYRVGCLAHLLQLTVEDGIKNAAGFQRELEKLTHFVNTVRSSSTLSSKLRDVIARARARASAQGAK